MSVLLSKWTIEEVWDLYQKKEQETKLMGIQMDEDRKNIDNMQCVIDEIHHKYGLVVYTDDDKFIVLDSNTSEQSLMKDLKEARDEIKKLKETFNKDSQEKKKLELENKELKKENTELKYGVNIFDEWFNEKLELSNKDEVTSINTLFNDFDEWFNEKHKLIIKINKTEIKNYLIIKQNECKYNWSSINGNKGNPKFNFKIKE